ncbi:MAG: hypothetical protein KAT05_15015, partial [Spirochaetes bacterium]|nr:hypothetical protein [Spirochaetota bacterium]
MANDRQVIYLHHLPIEKPLRLGLFTIWPYYSARSTFIKDASVRKHLDSLFSLMCDYRNRPLKHIAVVSFGDFPDFKPCSEEIISKIRNTVNAFFLSAVIENSSIGAVSSENFRLIVQNFQPGSDRYAVDDGSYVQITIGGLRLKDAGVRLSPRVSQLKSLKYDMDLVDGCLQCLKNGSETLQKQIFSSLQWFSCSYDNAPGFLYHNRILLLMIAFELLAAHPNSLSQIKFAKWLEATWKIPTRQKYRLPKEPKYGPYGNIGWWGISFYRLRNKVIHEGNISELPGFDNFKREYFKTGVYVFSECLKELLCQAGFFTMSAGTDFARAYKFPNPPKERSCDKDIVKGYGSD